MPSQIRSCRPMLSSLPGLRLRMSEPVETNKATASGQTEGAGHRHELSERTDWAARLEAANGTTLGAFLGIKMQ